MDSKPQELIFEVFKPVHDLALWQRIQNSPDLIKDKMRAEKAQQLKEAQEMETKFIAQTQSVQKEHSDLVALQTKYNSEAILIQRDIDIANVKKEKEDAAAKEKELLEHKKKQGAIKTQITLKLKDLENAKAEEAVYSKKREEKQKEFDQLSAQERPPDQPGIDPVKVLAEKIAAKQQRYDDALKLESQHDLILKQLQAEYDVLKAEEATYIKAQEELDKDIKIAI